MTPPTEQKKPRPHWREVKLHRVVLLFAIIVGGLWALAGAANLVAWFIEPYLLMRMVTSGEPELRNLPSPLRDTGVATLTGLRTEKYGCSFQVPWKAVVHERDFEAMVLLRFDGNAQLIFMNPTQALSSLADMAKKGPDARAGFAALFGEKAIRSNYDLDRAALYARPGDVRWWNSRRAHIQLFELLAQKSILLSSTYQVAHPLATEFVRGFQFDGTDGQSFRLFLFDAKDRKYEIDLRSDGTLTQPQINAIVASFQPLP
jgi:hypothetical protein